MAIITLTTDFGDQDYYVPAFKGEILSACPSVQLVDVCHSIPPFEITQAAYVLGNAYPHFPKRTIHVARVFEHLSMPDDIIVCTYNDHFFIAPDNGLLSIFFERAPSAAVSIDASRLRIRSPHELYTRAIRTLVYNGSLSDLGPPIRGIEVKHVQRPIIQEESMRGVIAHIDHYGNAITNIRRNEFEQAVRDRRFHLVLRRSDFITRLAEQYSDVPEGEILARFNSKEMLEVSVNCGRADELLGLRKGDNVKIEYG